MTRAECSAVESLWMPRRSRAVRIVWLRLREIVGFDGGRRGWNAMVQLQLRQARLSGVDILDHWIWYTNLGRTGYGS